MGEWLWKYRELLFSGIGVALIGWFIQWLISRRKAPTQTQRSGANSINIQASRDISIGKGASSGKR
jgi:hypothetical protein